MTIDDAGPGLPTGAFIGRETFRTLVRAALARAAHEGWRELIVCDAGFQDWPLGERAVVESLQQWASGGRRLTMLAADYAEVQRRHARFVQWRVRWDHIIVCRRAGAVDAQDLPSAIWSPQWVLQRHDPLRCNGVTGVEPDLSPGGRCTRDIRPRRAWPRVGRWHRR